MKIMERWLVKLILFHFIILLIVQGIFHEIQLFNKIQKVSYYEGVNKTNETPIMETWNSK